MKYLAVFVLLVRVVEISGCERIAEDVLLREPAPPIVRPIGGIRSVRVTVANVSKSRYLAPDYVAAGITENIQVHAHGVDVLSATDGRVADGILAISIIDEIEIQTRSKQKSDEATWKFRIKFSGMLTRKDGTIVWSSPLESVVQEMTWSGFQAHGIIPDQDQNVRQDLVWLIGDKLSKDLSRLR